jgi:hypothetical protein
MLVWIEVGFCRLLFSFPVQKLIAVVISRLIAYAYIPTFCLSILAIFHVGRICPAFIIFNRLDECASWTRYVLQNLAENSPIPMLFLVASRPEPLIREFFLRMSRWLQPSIATTPALDDFHLLDIVSGSEIWRHYLNETESSIARILIGGQRFKFSFSSPSQHLCH